MLITGIKSRPIYTTLAPDLGGRFHLLVGQGSGGDALLRLLKEMPEGADIRLLYATESVSGMDRSEPLCARGLPDLQVFSSQAEAVVALDSTLAGCVMGTRLYIAGSESFIGSAVQVAMKYNLNADEVQREHCGSAARRVYCIHCKASNENVTTNVVTCTGCGRHLLVRDHYSRRLGAYMGVMVDAEAPGELPVIQEVFGMIHAQTIPVEVVAVEQVTPVIKQFTLRPIDGAELPPFAGGCHVIVVMHGKDRTFRNPYSLLSSPRDLSSYQIAVRRHDQGRGGSLFMHQQVQVGTHLEVAHPVNLFPLAKLARKHILIAGGVGITPMMAMIDDLRTGAIPWQLHYGVRGPDHDHFGRKLQTLVGDAINLCDDSAGQTLDFEQILADQPLGTHVYTCGSGGMIEDVAIAAKRAGWADSHIHSEKFTVPPVGAPFEVYLARSKLTVHVPSERSLLEAVEAAGVDAPYLCRGGVCGQCETDVIELHGELLHNDHWLSGQEKASGNKIMPCVSRARCTRLVLDR